MKLLALFAIAGSLTAQTFRISCVSTTAAPGQQTLCQVYLDGAGIAAGQLTLGGSTLAALTNIAGRGGPSATAAGKTASCGALKTAGVTCQISGMNQNVIAPSAPGNPFGSSVMDLVLTWGATAGTGSTLALSSPAAAAADGTAISITIGSPPKANFNGGDASAPPPPPPPPPPSTNNCDLNKDGKIDQADVLIAIGGLLTGAKDLSYLGKILSAASGGACAL